MAQVVSATEIWASGCEGGAVSMNLTDVGGARDRSSLEEFHRVEAVVVGMTAGGLKEQLLDVLTVNYPDVVRETADGPRNM